MDYNFKIKPLSVSQMIISIDRLTRFKETEEKYLRVFKDLITSALIVYPSVCKYFGIEVKDKYKVVNFDHNITLSYKDYLITYIRNIRSVLRIQRLENAQ